MNKQHQAYPFTRIMGKIKRIHFVGIGGTGMCGIAEVLLNEGYVISGSDLSNNVATQRLNGLGAKIFYGHDAKNIEGVDVVIKSTAIRDDNPEIIAAQEGRIPVVPRAEMLAELMRFRYGIAVAGTHGKTTTTSLVTSILAEADMDPTFIIGGKLNSADTNARLGSGRYLVAEADESDASFLYLQPMIAVVTNIDADHMGTYEEDFSKLRDTFIQFCHHLPFYGLAVICLDDPEAANIIQKVNRRVLTYGISEKADVMATNIKTHGMKTSFTVKRFGEHEDISVQLNMPGEHNVLNSLAAIAIATELGASAEAIQSALLQFEGVGRRFQVLGEFNAKQGTALVIDDYGHHPREIAVTLEAARQAFPDKRIVLAFQPHRYSRTQSLFDDFSESLSAADVLFVLDVYPAGEEPIAGVDSRALCRSIRQRGKVEPIFVAEDKDIAEALYDVILDGDVLFMQGAGSIGKMARVLIKSTNRIEKKSQIENK